MHTSERSGPEGPFESLRATDVASARHGRAAGAAPVFLLSPASLSGVRGKRLLDGSGSTQVVERLARGERLPICEVYASISSLYFRGKLAYARRFACVPHALGVRVITSDRGLYAADDLVGMDDLRRMARSAIDEREPDYRAELVASALRLAAEIAEGAIVVLLGSVATPKYLDPLTEVLQDRLRIPREFIGLGDMSRGSLLLRAVAEGRQLDYVPPPVRGPRASPRRSKATRRGAANR